jgi:hypothetical protein
MPSNDTSLADDLLRGADEIGAFINRDRRQTFYLLQTATIPAFKENRLWVASKSILRKHYTESRFAAPKKERAPLSKRFKPRKLKRVV